MATPTPRVKRPTRKAKGYVRRISNVLQKRSNQDQIGIKISEVVVGGSLGQGTIVHGHYDIDLIVFSTSLHPSQMEVTEAKYKEILAKMRECLERGLKGLYAPRDKPYLFHGWKFGIGPFDVDLQLSPQWKQPDLDDLYDHLQKNDRKKRILFSCGTAKHQNELLKLQPPRVRVLITRFKAWRNETWKEPINGCPKSYLISMLVIIAYSRAPVAVKTARKIRRLASKVTSEIKDLVKRQIQGNPELDLHVPGENERIMSKYKQHLPDKPRIIDPVNPFKNLYNQGLRQIEQQRDDSYAKRWEIFAAKINSLDLTLPTAEGYIPRPTF